MRVVHDHQIFSCQERGGISRTHCLQAQFLDELPGVFCRIVAPRHGNLHLREVPGHVVEGGYLPWDALDKKALLASNQLESQAIIDRLAPDVVHETYFTDVEPHEGNWRVVVTVFDMTHERYPEHCHPDDRTAERKRRAVARADLVICPTVSTKRDLLEHLDIDPAKISLVRNCSGRIGEPPARDAECCRPFFLYVGNRGGFKNFPSLLKALGRSFRLKKELGLVCVGGGEFSPEELGLIRDLRLEGRIELRARCGDEELARLYSRARALVFPSFCEGFGMPLVEAMHYSCPVVCANATSLPEVAGEAAVYFDPMDVEDMVAALERAAFDEEVFQALQDAGPARAALFSPEIHVRDLVSAYKTVM